MFKIWLMALRPQSFTASLIPALMGPTIALWMQAKGLMQFRVSWFHFWVVIVGCLAIHSVSNLVNDYVDYQRSLDKSDNSGAINMLVRGEMTLTAMRVEILVCAFIAASIGGYLLWVAGSHAVVLLGLVIFGALSAYFYTAPPLSLKYRGWGDIQVILSFGVLMVFGAFYVQTWQFSWLPMVYALPIGLLVDDILHLNNFRDMQADQDGGIATLALKLGEQGTKNWHYMLSFGAYLMVILLIATGSLPLWSLLTLISLPYAIKLAQEVQGSSPITVDPMIVGRGAALHAQFGILMMFGFNLDRWFLA